MELQKIHDYAWRIPKHGAMRVDGIVYASRAMLDQIRQDESLKQVINVATLPGIVGASLAMPDIHWGYGFPIGGVAAFDERTGVVSPGGVGYDINCLCEGSRILCELGYHRPIESFGSEFGVFVARGDRAVSLSTGTTAVVTLDRTKRLLGMRRPSAFMRRSASHAVHIATCLGISLSVTPEHPILTRDRGMVRADRLRAGDAIAACFYEGVPYVLREDQALPTGIENERMLGIMAKVLGYFMGDGTLSDVRGKYRASAAGVREDLERMRDDLSSIGVKASVFTRTRPHLITTQYGTRSFVSTTSEIHIYEQRFCRMLELLGMPCGTKTITSYEVPAWIMDSPLWIKRLFLAGLFGAELTAPKTMSRTGFYVPLFSQNKNEPYVESGRLFMLQIEMLLNEFGIVCTTLADKSEHLNAHGKTVRVRLEIAGNEDNLLSLYQTIGFEYARAKERLACIAVKYILSKKRLALRRQEIATDVQAMRVLGMSLEEVKHEAVCAVANGRFVERHYYFDGDASRIPQGFPSFTEYVAAELGDYARYGVQFDCIDRIDRVPYDGLVYDFTVDDTHTFIADGIVVSNCGVRLLRTNLEASEIVGKERELVNQLFRDIPTGVGSHHRDFKLSPDDEKQVLKKGAGWAVERGYGDAQDLECIESNGCIPGADPQALSHRAQERGSAQLGTLGSGNHFVEIQRVDEIYDSAAADVMGLFPGQLTVTIHTGSRGLGHQVCEDHIEIMLTASRKYGIELPDKQLCCAPIGSPEATRYLAAMAAAANFAFANRQMIMHWVREVLERKLHMAPADLGIAIVYDVAHNIAKFEEHMVGGRVRRLLVHRKGATRAYPAGHHEISRRYRAIGQPVLIPGDMGRYSFVLVGTQRAMDETFGSTCHGAGRLMSRHAAKRACRGRNIEHELEKQGIIVRGASHGTVVEEVPEAYKDVADVVDAVDGAGISKKVARLRPLGVIKG